MTERVNFILTFNGVTYRFASMLVGDDLLCAVKTKVVAITNCNDVEMYWRDEESDIVLDTIEDLVTAIDYAKATRRKPSKTPCVNLVALVPAPPAEEKPLAQDPAEKGKPDESTATSFLDELLSGIQTVAITEHAAEPWQTMFSPPLRVEKEKGGELKGKLQRMREMRKEDSVLAAAAEIAANFERDRIREMIRIASPDVQQKRSKPTINEQKRIREDSIRFLSEVFPERYSMAAAAIVNSEKRMMTRREITEWAKITFPAFKTLGVRYSDDIRKSLRNGDCFVKVSRLAKEKDEKRLWTINPKYVIDEQMKRECAKNVAEKSKREENDKNADAASSALQREGVLTSPMKKEAASVPAHMSGKEGDITAAERKKVKCITDWAQPMASAAMVECIPKVAQKHHKKAAATRLTLLQEGVLRLPMKKEAANEPPRPSAVACDATPAERKKAKLITDWAQPVAAAAAAAPKAERAAKATQEHKKNAATARLTLQHEGVLRSPMKKEPARMGGKILLDITAAERIVKKTKTITDWAHPVAAAVAPMVECLASSLQQEGALRSALMKEKPNPKTMAIDSALRKQTPVKTKVFISYRRKSGESLASLVRVLLHMRGYEALMVTDKWDTMTLETMIKSAQHFIAVLTPNSLHDFNHGDRFHKELRCAFAHIKSIIPMFDQFFEFPDDEESIPQDIRKIASLSGVRWVHAYQEQCMNHVDRKMRSSEKAVVPIAAVASPDAVAVKMPLPAPVDSLAKPKKEKVVKEEDDDERTKSLNVKVYVSYRRGPDDELASLVKAHLIQRGYEDFVDENDDTEPLAAKIQSAAHFIVLLTPFSFEYFKRDSLFSKELQCAVSHKRHPLFIVGKHFEYPERTCSREHPIPQETRKMLEENEKGRYITIKWNNDDQDESMDQLNRMLRNADFGHYYDLLYHKKERKMLMRECDAIRQTFMKDLEKRELAMKEDARLVQKTQYTDPIKAEMQQSMRQTFTENLEKREREFKLTIMHESVLPLKKAESIMAKMQQSPTEKEEENVDGVEVGVEALTQEFNQIREREERKVEKEIKKTRRLPNIDERILAKAKHMKRDRKLQMKQAMKAVRKQKAAAAAAVEAHPINAEVQQSDFSAEKEWEEVDEELVQVEEDEWSHGDEDVVEDEAVDHTDESLSGSTDGVQKKEEADEWSFDEEADDIFERVSTDCEDEEDEEEFFEKVSTVDSGEEERDHEDEWSCEEVEDADEDHANILDLSSITDEDASEDAREMELSVREEALALKEVAFERRMAEYAVKMEEFEEKMKGLEKRVERIEKKRADDYDTDQEYDDLLGEREAARAALPALREEIQASLRAQAIKYKTKK